MLRKFISRVFNLPSRNKGTRPKVIPFSQHGIQRDRLSSGALRTIERLQEGGFNAFVVGGAVRDLLLGAHPKDFDIATNATPEQVHHLFRRSRIIGRRFRIVHVLMGPETLEVTTFRGGDDKTTDQEGRILNDNVFGSQEEDARRRDFTVNALFYNPTDETIIDYHHGVRDVHAKKLVMIGNPVQRYREDPVRMLRAVRLAAKLGLAPEVVGFNADEDMNDDLRNMVWKGHYLGTQPADVMMHVPVDPYLAKANDKVRIFGAYHREALALARRPEQVRQAPSGSAAVALEVFTREKIGVETASLADSFLLGVLNGRLRENVVHFKTVGEATQAALEGKIAAVMAPRAELEAALKGRGELTIDTVNFPELQTGSWPLGMAVKVEEQELADAIAAALAELKRDGSLAEIFRRHGISHTPA